MSNNNSTLKICMVGRRFYPHFGGAERQAQRIGTLFAEKKSCTFLVTERFKYSLRKMEIVHGISVYRISQAWWIKKIVFIRRFLPLFWGLSLFMFLFKTRNKFDLIFCYFVDKYSFASILCAKILKKKIVLREGVAPKSKIYWNRHWGRVPYRNIIKHADMFIGVSRELVTLLRNSGIAENKLKYIPNGIPVRQTLSKPESKVKTRNALIVARLDNRQKGIDIVLKAWLSVRKKYNDAILTVLGDGPEKGNLEKEAKDLGIHGSVHFVGFKKDVQKYLAKTNIFVLPSRSEGMPNALLEAMSYGLPCIATPVGGIPDIITDGVNGSLVPVEDHMMLAKQIIVLLSSPEMCEKIGSCAQKTIKEHFDIKESASKYLSLFRNMMTNS